MSGDSTVLLQRALLARLLADAPVAAEVGARIYDTFPPNVTYPAIAFNDMRPEAFDTDNTDGAAITFTMAVYARGENARIDARRIAEKIVQSLHRCGQSLTVTGHKVVMCYFITGFVIRSDLQTKGEAQAIYTFRAVTESLTPALGG